MTETDCKGELFVFVLMPGDIIGKVFQGAAVVFREISAGHIDP